jgi:hypothetical protein
MSRRTTQFIYSLLGINQNPPAPPPPPAGTSIPPITGSSQATENYPNPLNNPALATKLKQENNGISTASEFDMEREYNLYAPSGLVTAYANAPLGSKPRPKVVLFYGVGVELSLFRLRDFFNNQSASAIITISGVEAESSNPPAANDSWAGIHTAFGYGISKQIIKDLFVMAGFTGMTETAFDVEVMAGYSTGYRGVNLTIINELVELSTLKRLIYFDAWYFHNDHPLMPTGSPYRAKNTLFAVDTALAKSPSAELVIYAFTTGGVPRTLSGSPSKSNPNPPKNPVDTLITKYPGRVKFIDFEWKFGTRPAIDAALEKICLARLIQLGIGSKFPASAIAAPLKALVDVLPAKGSLGTLGRAGYTDLYGWITSHSAELAGFSSTNAMTMVTTHDLLSTSTVSWTTTSLYEMRHRMFIIELGKEPLLP